MSIDYIDWLLFLCGIYVPYYWVLKSVRKELIKGNITIEEANGILKGDL